MIDTRACVYCVHTYIYDYTCMCSTHIYMIDIYMTGILVRVIVCVYIWSTHVCGVYIYIYIYFIYISYVCGVYIYIYIYFIYISYVFIDDRHSCVYIHTRGGVGGRRGGGETATERFNRNTHMDIRTRTSPRVHTCFPTRKKKEYCSILHIAEKKTVTVFAFFFIWSPHHICWRIWILDAAVLWSTSNQFHVICVPYIQICSCMYIQTYTYICTYAGV